MNRLCSAVLAASLVVGSCLGVRGEQPINGLLAEYHHGRANNFLREETVFLGSPTTVFYQRTTNGLCVGLVEREIPLSNGVRLHQYVGDSCSSRRAQVYVNGSRLPSIDELWSGYERLEEQKSFFEEEGIAYDKERAFVQQKKIVDAIFVRASYNSTFRTIAQDFLRNQ